MRKLIIGIAGLAIAAAAYLAGTTVQAHQDNGARQQLMGAVVGGQSIGIDGRTYVARPQR